MLMKTVTIEQYKTTECKQHLHFATSITKLDGSLTMANEYWPTKDCLYDCGATRRLE